MTYFKKHFLFKKAQKDTWHVSSGFEHFFPSCACLQYYHVYLPLDNSFGVFDELQCWLFILKGYQVTHHCYGYSPFQTVFCQASFFYAWQFFDHFSVSAPGFLVPSNFAWARPDKGWGWGSSCFSLISAGSWALLDLFSGSFRKQISDRKILWRTTQCLWAQILTCSVSMPSWILYYSTNIFMLKLVKWLWC